MLHSHIAFNVLSHALHSGACAPQPSPACSAKPKIQPLDQLRSATTKQPTTDADTTQLLPLWAKIHRYSSTVETVWVGAGGSPTGHLGNLKRWQHNMKRWEDHMKRSNDYLENIWRTSRGCLETSGAHLEDMLGTSRGHLLHFPTVISLETNSL